MIAKDAIHECNKFFDSKRIDIIKYNLYASAWWSGRQAILLKNYQNISGGVLFKGMQVCIVEKMQTFRFGKPLHRGMFCVRGSNNIEVFGVVYSDLVLK